MVQQAWTTAELETFEAIELPAREVFTGLSCGFLKIGANINVKIDVDVDLDLDLGGGDCDNDCD